MRRKRGKAIDPIAYAQYATGVGTSTPAVLEFTAKLTKLEQFESMRSLVFQRHRSERQHLTKHFQALHCRVTAGDSRETLGVDANVYSLLSEDWKSVRRAVLAPQRRLSLLRASLLKSDAFRRVFDAQPNTQKCIHLIKILHRLGSLRSLSAVELKRLRSIYLTARKDAETTVRVLRSVVARQLLTRDQKERDTLLMIAKRLERQPELAGETIVLAAFDLASIGKQVDTRAAAICEIARLVPEQTKNRPSAIAELVSLAGWPAPSAALVATTLKARRTK